MSDGGAAVNLAIAARVGPARSRIRNGFLAPGRSLALSGLMLPGTALLLAMAAAAAVLGVAAAAVSAGGPYALLTLLGVALIAAGLASGPRLLRGYGLLANTATHAGAGQVRAGIRHQQGMLRLAVGDDGCGGAGAARGTGLSGIERRLAAFDGVLAVTSPPGGPTVATMEIPCVLAAGP